MQGRCPHPRTKQAGGQAVSQSGRQAPRLPPLCYQCPPSPPQCSRDTAGLVLTFLSPPADPRTQAGVEEYWDYIFPEEAGAAPHLKLLELAYKHKRQKLGAL